MIEFSYDSKKKVGIISGDMLSDIREHFSVKNEAAVFMRRYGRFMPPRTYAITPTGRFEPCLYFTIKDYIRSCNYVGDVTSTRELQDVVYPARHTWQQQLDFNYELPELKLPLRSYQEDIVKKCLGLGRGTVILATAGGKTLTSASLITKIYNLYKSTYNKGSFRALFVVPDRGLVEQTAQDFMDYGVPFSVSKWTGDDDLDLSSNVIVANLGILQSKNSDLSWLKSIDLLIVDEVHKIRKGNKVNDIFKLIETPFRFGFTGTMPEEVLDQWNIVGKIGPIIYEKNSHDLRQDNYVSNVQITILNLIYKDAKKIEYKEEIKIGFNLKRKRVLMTCFVLIPVLAYFDLEFMNYLVPHQDTETFLNRVGIGWLWLGVAAVVFRMIQLTAIQSRRVAITWCIKILTDPFHDFLIYRKAPFYLMKGQLIDPDLKQDYE